MEDLDVVHEADCDCDTFLGACQDDMEFHYRTGTHGGRFYMVAKYDCEETHFISGPTPCSVVKVAARLFAYL